MGGGPVFFFWARRRRTFRPRAQLEQFAWVRLSQLLKEAEEITLELFLVLVGVPSAIGPMPLVPVFK